jgi:hypothetical protein
VVLVTVVGNSLGNGEDDGVDDLGLAEDSGNLSSEGRALHGDDRAGTSGDEDGVDGDVSAGGGSGEATVLGLDEAVLAGETSVTDAGTIGADTVTGALVGASDSEALSIDLVTVNGGSLQALREAVGLGGGGSSSDARVTHALVVGLSTNSERVGARTLDLGEEIGLLALNVGTGVVGLGGDGAGVLVTAVDVNERGAGGTEAAGLLGNLTGTGLGTTTAVSGAGLEGGPGTDLAVDGARVGVAGVGVGERGASLTGTNLLGGDGTGTSHLTSTTILGAGAEGTPGGDLTVNGAEVTVAVAGGRELGAGVTTVLGLDGDGTAAGLSTLGTLAIIARLGTSGPGGPGGDLAVDGAVVGVASAGLLTSTATGTLGTRLNADGAGTGLTTTTAVGSASRPGRPLTENARLIGPDTVGVVVVLAVGLGTVLGGGGGAGKDGGTSTDTGGLRGGTEGHLRDGRLGEVELGLGDLAVLASVSPVTNHGAGVSVDGVLVREETVVLGDADVTVLTSLEGSGLVGELVGEPVGVTLDHVSATGEKVPTTPGTVLNSETGGRNAPEVLLGGLDSDLVNTTLGDPADLDGEVSISTLLVLTLNSDGVTTGGRVEEGGKVLVIVLARLEGDTLVVAELVDDLGSTDGSLDDDGGTLVLGVKNLSSHEVVHVGTTETAGDLIAGGSKVVEGVVDNEVVGGDEGNVLLRVPVHLILVNNGVDDDEVVEVTHEGGTSASTKAASTVSERDGSGEGAVLGFLLGHVVKVELDVIGGLVVDRDDEVSPGVLLGHSEGLGGVVANLKDDLTVLDTELDKILALTGREDGTVVRLEEHLGHDGETRTTELGGLEGDLTLTSEVKGHVVEGDIATKARRLKAAGVNHGSAEQKESEAEEGRARGVHDE